MSSSLSDAWGETKKAVTLVSAPHPRLPCGLFPTSARRSRQAYLQYNTNTIANIVGAPLEKVHDQLVAEEKNVSSYMVPFRFLQLRYAAS